MGKKHKATIQKNKRLPDYIADYPVLLYNAKFV